MPGWGEWAGAGIDPNEAKKGKNNKKSKRNKRSKKVLVINPVDVAKSAEDKAQLIRRDQDLAHVIISEKKDLKLADFQVIYTFLHVYLI